MTLMIDDVIAAMEAAGAELTPGGVFVPPPPTDLSGTRSFTEVMTAGIQTAVAKRWTEIVAERERFVGATPDHWIWKWRDPDYLGSDGEYWVWLRRTMGTVTATASHRKGGWLAFRRDIYTGSDASAKAEAQAMVASYRVKLAADTITIDGASGVRTVPTTSPAVVFYGGNVGAKVVKGE